jgi:hypothetical protein
VEDEDSHAPLLDAWRNPALGRLLTAFAGLNLAETAFVTALAIHAFQTSGTLALGLVGARLVAGSLLGAVLGPMLDVRLGYRPLGRVALARTVLLAAGAAGVIAGAPLGAVLALLAVDAMTPARTARRRPAFSPHWRRRRGSCRRRQRAPASSRRSARPSAGWRGAPSSPSSRRDS